MNELNQLMVAEQSVFADVGGGGELAQDLGKIIERAQQAAYRSVDVMLVYRNWFLGKRIAEEELKGADRAEYGKEAMTKLAVQLTAKYGPGFDFGSLCKYLAFFKRFKIWDSLRPKSGGLLSWTHYRKLLQVENDEALRWYLRIWRNLRGYDALESGANEKCQERSCSHGVGRRIFAGQNEDTVRSIWYVRW